MTSEKSEEALRKKAEELFGKEVDINRLELEDYAKKNNWEILEWLGPEPGKLEAAMVKDLSGEVFEIWLEESEGRERSPKPPKRPPPIIEKSEFIRKVQKTRHRD